MKKKLQPKKKKKSTSTPQQAPSPSDSQNLVAAKEAERQADRDARQARASAEAVQREAEQAAKASHAKEREVETVKGELEAVSAQLARMSLDDPAAQPLGSRLRHCELLLTRLQGEAGGCRETQAVAQHTMRTLGEAAARAEAAARNAARWTTLQALREAFPLALERLLVLVRERTTVLTEADDESHASNLPRLGRARLLPTRDQIRGGAMNELVMTLSRHMAGFTMTPSAPLEAFSADGGGEVEPPTDGESVEEWVPVMTVPVVAEGGDDV